MNGLSIGNVDDFIYLRQNINMNTNKKENGRDTKKNRFGLENARKLSSKFKSNTEFIRTEDRVCKREKRTV